MSSKPTHIPHAEQFLACVVRLVTGITWTPGRTRRNGSVVVSAEIPCADGASPKVEFIGNPDGRVGVAMRSGTQDPATLATAITVMQAQAAIAACAGEWLRPVTVTAPAPADNPPPTPVPVNPAPVPVNPAPPAQQTWPLDNPVAVGTIVPESNGVGHFVAIWDGSPDGLSRTIVHVTD